MTDTSGGPSRAPQLQTSTPPGHFCPVCYDRYVAEQQAADEERDLAVDEFLREREAGWRNDNYRPLSGYLSEPI